MIPIIVHMEAAMRTNVVLDDDLLREAFGLTGVRTKKDLIHLALEELIRVRRKKDLTELAGRIHFRKGFNHKRQRELRRGSR
jgi:Arc/MetJ family transcription regulator